MLKDVQFVPVANATRLVAPSHLFSRLREDLAPFAYEVPAAFSSNLETLKTAGVRDSPSTTNLLHILRVAFQRKFVTTFSYPICISAVSASFETADFR